MTGVGAGPAAQSGGDAAEKPIAAPAGLPRRWCALVYEGLLLFALFLVTGFAALPLIGLAQGGPAYSAQQLYVLPLSSSAFLFCFYAVVAGVYCVGFWSNGRRTLAMKTWNLMLVTRGGNPPDIRRATIRYFAGWIGPAAGLAGFALFGRWGLAAGLLNYGWGWLDGERQFLHDRIAGTRVIRV